jgi:O-antigen/teichoic acid export membrane protein
MMYDQNTRILTSGRLLARNTVFNLIGQGAPMVVAIFAIPLLIKGLGTDRFGVLTLAWMVVGYFSLFDMGLGRALTKLLAEKLGTGQVEDIPKLIWTALPLMGVLGVIGALVVASISSWLVYSILNIPANLQVETLKACYILALSIPIVISTAGLRGVMEAHQRFGQVNAVRIPMGIFTFLAPLVVLQFCNSLYPVVAVLVVGRVIAWGAHLALCLYLVPALRRGINFQRTMVRPLASFGGWMTVSNMVGPMLLYMDRFMIASFISVTAVAYYTTPYEVITKLLIVPSAILGVLFPAFSLSYARDRKRVSRLYIQGIKCVSLIILPIALGIIVFAKQGLSVWLNDEFAVNSSLVAQLLVVGVFINSLGLVSQSLVQAAGRPDLTAKLHLIELPLYLTYLWFLLHKYGINGAAGAWLIRVSISAVILAVLAFLIIEKKP